jgi:predicted O-methyltransferase YrrM
MLSQSLEEIKDYLERRFAQESTALSTIHLASIEAKLPSIQVPLYIGKFLYLLAKIHKPHKILEIGTLGGYSSAWLAQALLPKGQLITLEVNPDYAALAKKNLAAAHLLDRINIRIGQAIPLLVELAQNQEGPFDLVFIDANKNDYSLYLEWAIHLTKPGSLILIDNLIPKGKKIGQGESQEAEMIYHFNNYLAQHPKLEVSVMPFITKDAQRLDGLAIIYVK